LDVDEISGGEATVAGDAGGGTVTTVVGGEEGTVIIRDEVGEGGVVGTL
jgi:hypothetical protein